MNKKAAAFVAGIVLLAAAVPMFAHHAIENEFDVTKFVTLSGTVTKVEWMNPHSNVTIQVKDSQGRSSNWTLEMEGPDAMTKAGWTRESVKQGDRVEASAWLAKDGSKRAHADSLTLTRRMAGALPAKGN